MLCGVALIRRPWASHLPAHLNNGWEPSLDRFQHLHWHIELGVVLAIGVPHPTLIFDQNGNSLIDPVDDALVFDAIESESHDHARLDAESDYRLLLRRD